MLMQSCVVSSEYNEDSNPRRESLEFLHHKVLNPALLSFELADFFDRYQEVRDDRGQALLLAEKYFGNGMMPEGMMYEECHMGAWGSIYLTETPGVYRLEPRFNNLPYDTYYVEALGNRRYHVASPQTKLYIDYYETDMNVVMDVYFSCSSDDVLVVEEMKIIYTEGPGREEVSTAEITSAASPVKCDMNELDGSYYMPHEGELDYKLKGTMFEDRFSVRYSNGNSIIL